VTSTLNPVHKKEEEQDLLPLYYTHTAFEPIDVIIEPPYIEREDGFELNISAVYYMMPNWVRKVHVRRPDRKDERTPVERYEQDKHYDVVPFAEEVEDYLRHSPLLADLVIVLPPGHVPMHFMFPWHFFRPQQDIESKHGGHLVWRAVQGRHSIVRWACPQEKAVPPGVDHFPGWTVCMNENNVKEVDKMVFSVAQLRKEEEQEQSEWNKEYRVHVANGQEDNPPYLFDEKHRQTVCFVVVPEVIDREKHTKTLKYIYKCKAHNVPMIVLQNNDEEKVGAEIMKQMKNARVTSVTCDQRSPLIDKLEQWFSPRPE